MEALFYYDPRSMQPKRVLGPGNQANNNEAACQNPHNMNPGSGFGGRVIAPAAPLIGAPFLAGYAQVDPLD
jgi:hypothetical protein